MSQPCLMPAGAFLPSAPTGLHPRKRRRSIIRAHLCDVFAPASAALAMALVPAAHAQTAPALPQQGTFSAGNGAIGSGANGVLTVTQTSNRGVIDWRSFSIGAGGTVSIANGAGATLNRVTGGALSRVDGLLKATGSVYLINPAGIVVGSGGQVLTGGSFVASTRDIANGAFMAGGAMTAAGTGTGSVVNQGAIVARDGDVVLIGRSASNEGSIAAANGTATLAAANTVLLTTVGGPAGLYVAPDTSADGSVTQSGRISAAAAALKAAGGDIYTLAGNRSGLIAATGTATIDGQIWLTAPHGQVSAAGVVTAVNHDGTGGAIVANGAAVTVAPAAQLSASGTRGGSVLVGVSTVGGSDLAGRTTIGAGASITAGGPAGGGLVETSGHHVAIGAASITAGRGGTWRVDPVDLTIDAAAAATIATSLDAGTDVWEQTSAGGASGSGATATGNGDLTVAAPISWAGSGTLFLDAYHDLNLNAAISGGGGLVGTAGNAVTIGAPVSASRVSLSAAAGALTLAAGTTVGAGTGITLTTGGAFVNNAGAGALSAGSGRWLVRSADPANDTDGGLSPDFYQYAATAGTTPATSGNGRLFALAPTLAVTLSGTVAKTYDGTTAATFGAAATVAGLVNADAAVVSGTYADRNAGTGIGVTASSIAVTHNGVAVYGYAGTSPSVSAAIGTIDRAAVTATVVGTPTKTYNGTTTASLSSANYALAGFAAGESASVNQPSSVAYDAADAGARIVTATFSPTNFVAAAGTSLANYILPTMAAGAGRIDQAPLLITGVLATGKTYDRTTAGLLNTGSAGLYGIIGTDSVALDSSQAVGTFATASAAGGIAVTTSGFALTGAKAGNYAIVQPQGLTATIDRKPLALGGVTAATKVYDGTTTATLVTTGASLTGVIAGDGVALTTGGASGSFAGADAGTAVAVSAAGFGLSGAQASNYALVQPAGLAADITRRTLSVALTGTPAKTYNGSANAVVGTTDFTLSGFVAGQGATVGQTSNAVYASANAGSQGVTVTLNPSDYLAAAGTALSNYLLPTSAVGTGTINRAPLTIAVTGNPTKAYDGTAAATLASGNYQLSGFLAGEGASVTRTVGTYDSANAGVRGVSATLTASDYAAQAGTRLANYLLPTVASGYGTINPAALAGSIWAGITGNPTKSYDGTTVATLTSANFTLTGFAQGEGATVTRTVGAYSSKNAGTQTVVASLVPSDFSANSGTDLSNYTLPTSAYGSGTITPAVLTAAIIGNPTKVYNGTTTAALTGADYGVTGLASGESITIAPSVLAAYDSRNAGARTVTASFSTTDLAAGGGTLLSNYVLPTSASGAGTITLAPLTIVGVTAADRSYDTGTVATLRTGGAHLFGDVAGDHIALSTGGATASFATADAGSNLAVTASGFALTGADAANYRLLQPTGLSANILRAAVSLGGVAALDKSYDATGVAALATGAATLSGVYAADAAHVTLDASGATASFTSVNVGSGLRVNAGGFALTGTAAANYALAQPGGLTASITPAALTAVIVGNPTKVYDGSASTTLTAANYQLVGFVAGQGASVPQSATARYDVADAGTQGITSTLVSSDFRANAGTNLSNYVLPTTGTGTGTITRAPLAVAIVGNPTRAYDATTAASLTSANYVLSGFVGGQGASVTRTTGSYSAADAGRRGVTAVLGAGDYAAGGGTTLANYLLPTVASGTGTITRAALQVVDVIATSRAYDGGVADVLDQSGARVSGLFGADSVILDGSTATGVFASRNAGTGIAVTASGFAISGGQSANYTLLQPTGLAADITRATLTLTGVTRGYDASITLPTAGAAYSFAGTYGGDAVAIDASGVGGSYADKNVGTGKAVTVSGLALSGADAANYSIASVSGAAIGTITPAVLTAAGIVALDKIYDATNVAALNNGGATLSGLFAGDAVTLSTAGATGSFANKNAGTGKAVTLAGYTVSGTDAANYRFTQPAGVTAAITPYGGITLIKVIKTYDGTTTLPTLETAYWLDGVLAGDTVTAATGGLSGGYADRNAAGGIAVTLSGLALAGVDAANYSIAPSVANAAIGTINTRTLTAAITGNPTKTYDGTTAAALAAGNYTISGMVGGETATVTQASGTYASASAGSRVVTASLSAADFTAGSGTSFANYVLPTTASGLGTIGKLALAITGVSANDKTYNGTTAATLNVAGAALQNVIATDAGSVALGTAGATGVFASRNVGTGIAVTASGFAISGAKADNYVLSQPTGLSAAISQATLTLLKVSRVYNAGVAATGAGVTYLLGGAVGGDTVSVATGGLSGTFGDKNVGVGKSVSLSGVALTGGSAANYSIASTVTNAAIGTITAAPLTVTGAVASGKTYDGTTAAAINNAATVLGGVLGTDVVTLNAPTSGTFASANAGTRAVTISGSYTVSGTDAGNYAVTQPTGLSATIAAKALTATITGTPTRAYDGTTAATLATGNFALTGFVGSQGATVTRTSGTYAAADAGSRTVSTTLASSDFTATAGTSLSNYVLPTTATGAGLISQRALTVAITGTPGKTYDALTTATLASGNYAVAGFVAGQGASVTQTTGAYASADAGSRTVTASLAAGDFTATGGTNLANYVLPTSATGAGAIAQRALSAVISGNPVKTYDATTTAALAASDYTLSGFVAGQGASVGQTAGTYAFADAGSRGVTATLTPGSLIANGGTTLANYVLPTMASGTGTIVAKALGAAIVGTPTKTYDGTATATLTATDYQLSGFVAGQGASVGQTAGSYAGADAGNRLVTAMLATGDVTANSGTLLSNYVLPTTAAGMGAIGQRALGAAITGDPTRTYDATVAATLGTGDYTLSGFVAGQGASVTRTMGSYAGADAGGRTVTVALGAGDFAATGATNLANYILPTSASGAGTITQRLLTASITGAPTKTYDGTAAAVLAAGDYGLAGFVAGQGASVTRTNGTFASADAGSRAVTVALSAGDLIAASGTDLANYLLPTSASGTGTITPRSLTAAIIGTPTKTYDGTATATLAAADLTLSGFVAGQGASVGQVGGAYASADAGTRAVVATLAAGDFIAAGGTNLGNYALPTSAAGTGIIDRRPLAVAISGNPTRTYDATLVATLVAGDYSLTGLVAGESASVNQASGAYAGAGAGSHAVTVALSGGDILAGTGTSLANYVLPTAASGTGTILARALTALVIGTPTKIYDGTAAATLAMGDVVLGGFVAGQGASVTTTGGAYALADAGDRAVTASLAPGAIVAASGTDLANYILPTTATGTGLINRRLLSAAITGTPAKTYDGTTAATLAAADYSLAGFVAGQGASVVRTIGSYAGADVGGVAVSTGLAATDFAASNGTNLANYVLPTLALGTGTIRQRPLTATITGAPTRTYDATTAATLTPGEYTLAGFVAGEGASVTQTVGSYDAAEAGSRAVFATLSAGDVVAATGTDLANYVLPTGASGTGTIARRQLTAAITGTPAKTYDGTAAAILAAGDYALTGFVAGQGASVAQTAGTYASADAGSRAVTVTLSAGDVLAGSGTSLANYLLPTGASGMGSIAQRLLSAAITGTPVKTYDGTGAATLAAGDYTLTGFVAGQGAGVARTSGLYAGADAGRHAVSASLAAADFAAATGTDLANYLLPTAATGTGVIGQRLLGATVTATPTKSYDGTVAASLAAGDVTLSGFVAGQGASVGPLAGSFAGSDAGARGVAAGLTASDIVAAASTNLANYLLPTSASGSGAITARLLSAAITGTPTRSYDGTATAALTATDYTLSGFVAGQSASVTRADAAFAGADAGRQAITVTLTAGDYTAGTGTDLANYRLPTQASGTGLITPRVLNAAIVGASKVYDGATTAMLSAGELSLSGFVAGQGASVTRASGTFASADAGSRVMTAVLRPADIAAAPGTDLANYLLPAAATGTGTISPRTLTAAIVGTPTRKADGTAGIGLAATNFVLDGFVAGQGATISQTVGRFDGVAEGDHVVTATLGAGVLAANADTLLANYAVPAAASGAGLITPGVLVDPGSLHEAIAANLALRDHADPAAFTGLAQRAVLGASLGRTYVPYPAPSALSTWQTNGFAPLPSILTLDQPANDAELATRTAAPIINSTQQILLQGGADKAWRIVLPPLPGSSGPAGRTPAAATLSERP